MIVETCSQESAKEESLNQDQDSKEHLDDIEIGLACPICYNPYSATSIQYTPVMLFCAHSICFTCSSKSGKKVQRELGGFQKQFLSIQCPHCREETVCSDTRSLMSHYTILLKSSQMKRLNATGSMLMPEKSCFCCKKETDQECFFICTDCKMVLCEGCQLPHSHFPTTKNHNIFKIAKNSTKEDMIQLKIAEEMLRQWQLIDCQNSAISQVCSLHSSKYMYRCEADGNFVCCDCVAKEHNGHSLKSIADIHGDFLSKSQFQDDISHCCFLLKQYKILDDEIYQLQNSLHQEKEKLCEDICHRYFNELLATIEGMQQRARKTIESTFNEKMAFLCQKKFEIRVLTKNLEVTRDSLQYAIEGRSPVETILIHQDLQKQIHFLEMLSPTYCGFGGKTLVTLNYDELNKFKHAMENQSISAFVKPTWKLPGRRRTIPNPATDLFKGMRLQVLWKNHWWYLAEIKAVNESSICITYPGWPGNWDEWISRSSNRLAFALSVE